MSFFFARAAGAFALSMFLLAGCKDNNQRPPGGQAIPVSTQTVEAHDVSLEFEYPAKLRSPKSVEIYARVEGILIEQSFKEGDLVQEGAKLFKIDDTRYKTRVNLAQAQYEAALANLNKSAKDWKRVDKLYKQGVLTIDQHDDSLYNYQSAKATVASTQSALEDAMIDLGYTDVVASITGRVGLRNYDLGNLVGKGGSNVLTTVTQLSPLYIDFSIPSNDFYHMRDLQRDGVEVDVALDGGAVHDKKGKVDFIDSVLDPQTSSVKARALVDNDEYRLLPNQFVRVRLRGFEAKDSISIPQQAVLQDKDGSYVYLVKSGKASMVRVELGKALKNGEILVSRGLSDGDVLITSNLKKLREGAGVQAESSKRGGEEKEG